MRVEVMEYYGLTQPFSQAGARRRGAARASRTAAGRPRPNRSRG